METTLATRKPINELTVADLEAYPVWEFADDEESAPGRDETWVRPVATRVVPSKAFSITVAAEITTASGQIYSGFVGCSASNGLDVNAVGVLTKGEYVVFQVHFLLPSLRERAIAKLGLTENEIFPIQYVVRAPVEGQAGVAQGVIS